MACIKGVDLFNAFGESVFVGICSKALGICPHHCGRLSAIGSVAGTVSGCSEEVGPADWRHASTNGRRVG